MGTRRGRSVAAPSSSEESGPGIESRTPRSPRKPSRKTSATAAATGQRAVVETTGNGELEEADSEYNPRAFPYHVKQACWEKAAKVKGRDPDRWRRDALGNIVFRKLVGCPGCLCHDYDHIIPYSKGGKSTLENCQVLQAKKINKHMWTNVCMATANRVKSNRTDMSNTDLIQKSAYCRIQGRDMDLIELSAYANVRRGQEPGGCRIQ